MRKLCIFSFLFFWLMLSRGIAARLQVEVVFPPDLPKGEKIAIRDLGHYLKAMGGEVKTKELAKYTRAQKKWADVVILVQHPYGQRLIGKRALKKLSEDGFILRSRKERDQKLFLLWGKNLRGMQYAVYAFLEQLGVQFFHPEQEFVPSHLQFPEKLARLENPAFRYRGFHMHTTHPLELINSFSDCHEDIGFAKRWVDWIIKNRANYFTGGGRDGWVPKGCYQKRQREINAYREARGLLRISGISFGSYQQGGKWFAVDPLTGVRTKESVIQELEAKLGDKSIHYDLFGVHFGSTEFTTTDDIATVELFNTIARWMAEHRPEIPVFINSHTSGGQLTPHYKAQYYDLVQFAPTILGIQVHTMFFYDLIGPAPYYGNKDVRYKYEMMQREAAKGRALIYYPESAWWLSFDNDIPLYLPIYLKTRDNDIQLLKPLLKKTLEGHNTFTSGQEWGYWQTDWCIAKMQWDVSFRYTDCIKAITKPLEEAASTVAETVQAIALDQEQEFIYKNRFKYLSGEDEVDEVGAMAGIEGHPLRVPFSVLRRWTVKRMQAFEQKELQPLVRMQKRYQAWLQKLKSVKTQVPQQTRWIYDEIVDGVEIDRLRLAHIVALYKAVLSFQKDRRRGNQQGDRARRFWKEAVSLTKAAKRVIARREKSYRYPAEWSYGGDLSREKGQKNGTVYPYRVYYKTHIAFYWTRRDEQAKEVLEGKAKEKPVAPLLPEANGTVKVNLKGLRQAGDKLTIDSKEVVQKEITTFRAPLHPVKVTLRQNSGTSFQWRVVPLLRRYRLSSDRVKVLQPRNPMIQRTMGSIFPSLIMGLSADKQGIVLAVDDDFDGDSDTPDYAFLEGLKETKEGQQTASGPFVFYLTNPVTGEKIAPIHLPALTLKLKEAATTAQVEISGGIVTEDVVQAVMQLGGMDEKGTRALVASLLQLPPNSLPETIPFAARFQGERVGW